MTEKTDLMKHLGWSYICILIVLLHICQNQGLSKKDLAKTHLYRQLYPIYLDFSCSFSCIYFIISLKRFAHAHQITKLEKLPAFPKTITCYKSSTALFIPFDLYEIHKYTCQSKYNFSNKLSGLKIFYFF